MVLHDLFPALSWRSAISSADHLSLSANPNRSAEAERPRRICRRDHDKCGLENVPVSWESHPAGLSYPAISARPLISSAAEAMERNAEERVWKRRREMQPGPLDHNASSGLHEVLSAHRRQSFRALYPSRSRWLVKPFPRSDGSSQPPATFTGQ